MSSEIELVFGPLPARAEPAASRFLAQLPDGPRKNRIIVDCGGCHTFASAHARKDGRERTEEEWRTAIEQMLATAGQGSSFPIISGQSDPTADARWFTEALSGAQWPEPETPRPGLAPPEGALLVEYDVPEPRDLPHDLAVDGDGQILVTGMYNPPDVRSGSCDRQLGDGAHSRGQRESPGGRHL